VRKGTVGVESVELFLCLDSGKGVQEEAVASAGGVARNVVGDVEDEVGEESNLEDLVEGD